MPRPVKPRWVSFDHETLFYQPSRVPDGGVEHLTLTLDELEALRLADAEGLSQEESAVSMNVSRQTFGRIITAARKKVAFALVHGKGLLISGGTVEVRHPGGPHRGRRGPHGRGHHGGGQRFR
jgi:predicted DNA-binding protein (UPF0251 family)